MGCLDPNKTGIFPPPKLSIVSSVQHLPLFKSESFLRQKYEVERLSIKEIAADIFSSRTAVASHLKAYGIPIRLNDLQHKTRSQLRYGEAWRNRQIVLHQRELENIRKMTKLRDKGFSFWKIADIL